MEIKIGIYKITSPTGKNYIGQSVNIYKRFDQYSKFQCKDQQHLYNSLNKYGWDNHHKEILEEIYEEDISQLIEKLNEREVYWSEIHNASVDKGGLVLKIGGKHGYRAQETKDKISKSGKGKHEYTKTDEFKQKISKIHTGKEYSEESRKKMSDTKKGDNHFYKKSPRKITSTYSQAQSMVKINEPILCYDKEGKLLNEYINASEIIFKLFHPLDIKCTTGDIFANCNGKQLTCNNFIFQFKNNDRITNVLNKLKNDKYRYNLKKIYQYNLNNEYINSYNSTTDALKAINRKIGGSDIGSCCKGKQKSAFGYVWSYNAPSSSIISSSIPIELHSFLLKSPQNIKYRYKIIPKKWFIDCEKDKLNTYVEPLAKFIIERQPNFPFEKIKNEEKNINEIINYIQNYDLESLYTNNTFKNTTSSEGTFFLKSRFKSFWKSHYNKGTCPIDQWNLENIKRIISYRIGINDKRETFDLTLHQIVKGIASVRGTISFFKPILAASVYKHFLGKCINPIVIDPCAGFGGRLLGFKSIYPDGTYIGIEPNKETFKELKALTEEGKFSNVHLFNCKAEEYRETKECNLTFTSIPYFDKEIYSENIISNYSDVKDWQNKFINKGILTYNNILINLPNNLEYVIPNIKETYYLQNTSAHHLNKKQSNKNELILKCF